MAINKQQAFDVISIEHILCWADPERTGLQAWIFN